MVVQTYLEYDDPFVYRWRKGTPEDPFKHRFDSLPVINGVITLLEVPSRVEKVKISGMTEISQERYEKIREIRENEFLVNYSNGIIMFHPSHEGRTIVCEYFGRGIVLIPSTRIYAIVKRNPDVVKTLQEIIDESKAQLEETEKAIADLQIIINNAIEATNNANKATDNANQARDDAIVATENANEATQTALDAAASTIMIYKEPVPTFEDIETTYPEPENGWRVMVIETGDVYRFDGIETNEWQLVDNYTGGSIPYVSEDVSGILRSDDYKNFIIRTIAFVMPNIAVTGVQNYLIQSPFDGEIVNVKGYCTQTSPLSPLEIDVEKISEEGFDVGGEWSSMFSTNLIFQRGSYKSDAPTLSDNTIKKDDYLRINVIQLDTNFKGITVHLDIKINK